MNLIYLERQLRTGKNPEQLGGTLIGEGVCKAAYRFNNSFVVKLNAQKGYKGTAQKNPPKWIKQFGARGPRTYKAGAYIIQEFVTPLRDYKNGWQCSDEIRQQWKVMYDNRPIGKAGSDVHEYNCGVSAKGELVVFDW